MDQVGAWVVIALAFPAGCLVFDGKVAIDDGGAPDAASHETGASRDAPSDVSKRDAPLQKDASPRDSSADARTHDASAKEAAAGFCGSQRDATPLVCLDFDDASAPAAFFQSVTTTDGATVSIVTPDAAPSPPHTVRISLPGLDGGTASAYGQVTFSFLSQPKALTCSFEARYDRFSQTPAQGGETDEILSIGLEGQNIQSLDIEVFENLLLAQGFVAGVDGGLFAAQKSSFLWTGGTWVHVAVTIGFDQHQVSLSIEGTQWSSVKLPSLGTLGGGSVQVGGSQQGPSLAYDVEIDNLACFAE